MLLVPDRRRRGEEKAPRDHGGDEGESKEEEGVSLQGRSVPRGDGGAGSEGGVAAAGEGGHCFVEDDGGGEEGEGQWDKMGWVRIGAVVRAGRGVLDFGCGGEDEGMMMLKIERADFLARCQGYKRR